MINEINTLDAIVDLAISNGLFQNKEQAQAAIHSIGVVKAQVPELVKENQDLREKAEILMVENQELQTRLHGRTAPEAVPELENKPGPERSGDKAGPSRNKQKPRPTHKQNEGIPDDVSPAKK